MQGPQFYCFVNKVTGEMVAWLDDGDYDNGAKITVIDPIASKNNMFGVFHVNSLADASQWLADLRKDVKFQIAYDKDEGEDVESEDYTMGELDGYDMDVEWHKIVDDLVPVCYGPI